MKLKLLFTFFIIAIILFVIKWAIELFHNKKIKQTYNSEQRLHVTDSTWIPPNLYSDLLITGKEKAMVIYGKELIEHTSKYFGPNGSINKITNGMNCQNCHLDGGRRPWGNNFGAVFSMYPQYKNRSNSIQNISERVTDCFERSLNGKAIDSNSYEMKAICTYINWLGKNVARGKKAIGSGLSDIELINRAANAEQGNITYNNLCQNCHGPSGEGVFNLTGNEYVYPPLWGKNSYNDGSGLFRLSRFASFVLNNMPYNNASHKAPKLTIEQAWDVAAYIDSKPRPHFDQTKDWPDITKKSFDVPYGPYADSFSENQHKYGPYQEILKSVKDNRVAVNKN